MFKLIKKIIRKKKELNQQLEEKRRLAKEHSIEIIKNRKAFDVIKGNNAIRTSNFKYIDDPIIMFDYFFNQLEPNKIRIGSKEVNLVDCSKPKLQRFKGQDINFYFSSLAEGLDVPEYYLKKYRIKEGDIVLDCGAYCGTTVYYFSQLAGETGKVIALEPDKENYKALLKNIKIHNLKNVIPLNMCLWDKKGKLGFNTEGNLGSCLSSIHGEIPSTFVDATSIQDIINDYKIDKIDFIKMDIEGAEINVIESVKDYLKKNTVNLAIASYHLVDGQMTYKTLEKIFEEIGYTYETSRTFQDRDHGSLVTYANNKL